MVSRLLGERRNLDRAQIDQKMRSIRGEQTLSAVYQGWIQRGCLRGGGGGGGALQAKDFNRVAQAVSGGESMRVVEAEVYWRGVRGSSPGNFLKSVSLRMHFKPF